jgi:hypothetical protein
VVSGTLLGPEGSGTVPPGASLCGRVVGVRCRLLWVWTPPNRMVDPCGGGGVPVVG